MSQEQEAVLSEAEQVAMNKIAGLKQYDVYASETVYYLKKIWAMDESDAEKRACEDGFTNDEILDGDNFQVNEVLEVDEEE